MDASDRRRLDALLAALADGDRSAFDPFFELSAPIVRRYAERASGRDAEDVAQSALLKIFSRAGEYDPDRPALPWILAIVANEVRTHRKRVVRRREEALAIEPCALEPTPEDEIVERDLVRAIEAIAGGLPAIDRDAIRLAILEERPAAATFRKRLSRALAKLRHAWKEAHDG